VAITSVGVSTLAPVGMFNSTTNPAVAELQIARPTALAVGDLYVISAVFQSLTTDGELISPGFERVSVEIADGARLCVTQARYIATSADLADVATVGLRSLASSTRVAAVGVALRSSDPTKRPSVTSSSAFVASTTATSSVSWGTPSGSGGAVLGVAYSNTSAGTAAPTWTSVGGTVLASAVALGAATGTPASTTLVTTLGGTGVTCSPAVANAGGYALRAVEVSKTADPDPDPDPDEETPDAGADPGPDLSALATGDDVPVITVEAGNTTPGIPLSRGWYREKRVGASETGPGVSQSASGELDITGSSRFRYPGVPAAAGWSGGASSYVVTAAKPGGANQAAVWFFNVEFVVGNTSVVELRLNAPVANPTIGMILVNGKRISEVAPNATGINAGQGYRVRLTFPTAARRVIKIYGLNNNQGRFGGVAVEENGWVVKTNRTVTRRVVWITDSLANGAGSPPTGARGIETWAWDFARHLGADEVVPLGIGGTGYTRIVNGDPETTFGSRVPAALAMDPDVLIIQGGQNDSGSSDITTAVQSIMAATTSVPERIIIMTAPSGQVRSKIIAGLSGQHTLVEVQDRPFEIGPDGVHPTMAGQRQLAAAIIQRYEDGNPEVPPPVDIDTIVPQPGLTPNVRSWSKAASDGATSTTVGGGGFTMTGPPAVEIDDYVVVFAGIQTALGTASFQPPDGWTLLTSKGTSANRLVVAFGRPVRNGTERAAAMAPFTFYSNATSTRVVAVALALTDIDLTDPVDEQGPWAIGSAGAMTVSGAAGLHSLTVAMSNTSAPTARPDHQPTSGTKLGQITSGTEGSSSTTLSLHYDASGLTMTPTPANAAGFRLRLRQRQPYVGPTVHVVRLGQYAPAQLQAVAVENTLRAVSLDTWRPPSTPRTITGLMSSNPFYIAHRGSGDLWPEHTMKAYAEAVAHGMDAIEVSVQQTSDGVLICHHDTTTTRMTGVAHTIASTPWSTLAELTNTAAYTTDGSQPRQPIPLLRDVLDAFALTHVIFIEAKTGGAAIAMLNMMDEYPGSTSRMVYKTWGQSDAGLATAKARGYKTWGYGGSSDLPDLPEWGPLHDYIGVSHLCTDQQVQQYVAFGKPTIMWEIHTPADRDRALLLGVGGMMTSNIKAVMRVSPAL